ncbi:MAG TPA: hypothetical protein VHX15_03285 [Frankiaceae bacterium]|nr:hypothetical protein [Frankiaceae bacterium]
MAFAPPVLRRLALAVSVLYDVDLQPQQDGLLLTGPPEVHVSWETLNTVIEGADRRAGGEATEALRLKALAAWLTARIAIAAGDSELVALGIPSGQRPNPGAAWIREVIPGDALYLGFGYGPDRRPMPAGVLEHAGIDIAKEWQRVRSELERLGTLAAERERRQTRRAIKPFGSADVVTLLGSASLRRELVSSEGDGMIALIVPLRTRGWRATYVSDPAYGPALAAAMPELERGFHRPLLVTAEEISEVRPGGDPMRTLRTDEG